MTLSWIKPVSESKTHKNNLLAEIIGNSIIQENDYLIKKEDNRISFGTFIDNIKAIKATTQIINLHNAIEVIETDNEVFWGSIKELNANLFQIYIHGEIDGVKFISRIEYSSGYPDFKLDLEKIRNLLPKLNPKLQGSLINQLNKDISNEKTNAENLIKKLGTLSALKDVLDSQNK